jgi:preprotein translocase subunit YajC
MSTIQGASLFFLADAPAQPGFEQPLIMLALAFAFLYLILWRPEQKRRKALDTKRQSLKKGDRVIVAGGILGEVSKIQADSIIIKLADNAKMEVLKVAIQDVQPSSEAQTEETPPSA